MPAPYAAAEIEDSSGRITSRFERQHEHVLIVSMHADDAEDLEGLSSCISSRLAFGRVQSIAEANLAV